MGKSLKWASKWGVLHVIAEAMALDWACNWDFGGWPAANPFAAHQNHH